MGAGHNLVVSGVYMVVGGSFSDHWPGLWPRCWPLVDGLQRGIKGKLRNYGFDL